MKQFMSGKLKIAANYEKLDKINQSISSQLKNKTSCVRIFKFFLRSQRNSSASFEMSVDVEELEILEKVNLTVLIFMFFILLCITVYWKKKKKIIKKT